MEGADENSTKKESKKGLFRELDKLKNEIVYLRKELNRINREKESWFNKKEEYSESIREKITLIRQNREKRDNLTKKVRELKEKRNSLSEETGKKISEFKQLGQEKKKLLSKSGIRDPIALRTQIDRIETRLETEAMSFDKEKKLSKALKDLKKSLAEASDSFGMMETIKLLNNEINEKKKDTNTLHNEIQEIAKQSQVLHEGIIKISKEVDELKKKEEESFKNFIVSKGKFAGINSQLRENLARMSRIREKINKFTLEEEEKRKLKETMLIQSREKEFEEKFRTGKKLTTDDFLAFQDIIRK